MPYGHFALRRRCQSKLKQFSLPYPFSMPALLHHLADLRGRSLYLHPLPPNAAISGACGLLLETATDDHIFYEQRTARLHQEHIILHEVGHLLFGHQTVSIENDADRNMLLPDLDPRLIQRLLARTNYGTRQEREAEMLASLIRMSAEQPGGTQPGDTLGRLEAALGVSGRHDG
ncbi:hypothetical protein ACFPFX_25760 [Streptomyces mauvecolor]|uniref:IrrE N-terminal-like domain-containing protein n=1 Tax=Streptomyces mauvecolor TaxID=58345 RepID=A0ABV9UU96_9ACTN